MAIPWLYCINKVVKANALTLPPGGEFAIKEFASEIVVNANGQDAPLNTFKFAARSCAYNSAYWLLSGVEDGAGGEGGFPDKMSLAFVVVTVMLSP